MIIATETLTKVFRTEEVETTALDGINLEIRDGEFVALMGPSGCGKSTLLHVLGLVDKASHGTYRFLGQDVASLRSHEITNLRKTNIGFIFQSFNLIDELTVYENVELPLSYIGIPARERKGRAMGILHKLGMSHRENHFPVQLSGGQQQRVAVARAMVNNPKVILADEPTGNLDSEHGIEVMNLLRQINKDGSTVVMVTHSERDASFATRVVRLLDGKIAGTQVATA